MLATRDNYDSLVLSLNPWFYIRGGVDLGPNQFTTDGYRCTPDNKTAVAGRKSSMTFGATATRLAAGSVFATTTSSWSVSFWARLSSVNRAVWACLIDANNYVAVLRPTNNTLRVWFRGAGTVSPNMQIKADVSANTYSFYTLNFDHTGPTASSRVNGGAETNSASASLWVPTGTSMTSNDFGGGTGINSFDTCGLDCLIARKTLTTDAEHDALYYAGINGTR